MCTGFEAALLAVAAVGAGASTYGAIEQGRRQKAGLNMQLDAQQNAEDAATRQRKDAARVAAAAARRQPDLADIMAGESSLARLGSGRTTLGGNAPPPPPKVPTLGGY